MPATSNAGSSPCRPIKARKLRLRRGERRFPRANVATGVGKHDLGPLDVDSGRRFVGKADLRQIDDSLQIRRRSRGDLQEGLRLQDGKKRRHRLLNSQTDKIGELGCRDIDLPGLRLDLGSPLAEQIPVDRPDGPNVILRRAALSRGLNGCPGHGNRDDKTMSCGLGIRAAVRTSACD